MVRRLGFWRGLWLLDVEPFSSRFSSCDPCLGEGAGAKKGPAVSPGAVWPLENESVFRSVS